MRLPSLFVAILLLSAGLAGCVASQPFDGDETPRASATYEYAAWGDPVQGMQHWNATWEVYMQDFQGTFPQRVNPVTPVIALETQGPIVSEHVRLILTDPDGVERVNKSLTEDALPFQTTARGEDTDERWHLNLRTTEPVSGNFTVRLGDPATLGVYPQEPIRHEETLAQASQEQTWPWPSDGHAQLLVDATTGLGSATVEVRTQDDTLLREIEIGDTGPMNQTHVLHGAPGDWTMTFDPAAYTGDVSITLREW